MLSCFTPDFFCVLNFSWVKIIQRFQLLIQLKQLDTTGERIVVRRYPL